VQPDAVIEGLDVVEDSGASLSTGDEAVMINQFVFEAAPKGFDEGVIVAVALRLMEATRPCWPNSWR
jgi:hypothetical protein